MRKQKWKHSTFGGNANILTFELRFDDVRWLFCVNVIHKRIRAKKETVNINIDHRKWWTVLFPLCHSCMHSRQLMESEPNFRCTSDEFPLLEWLNSQTVIRNLIGTSSWSLLDKCAQFYRLTVWRMEKCRFLKKTKRS